MLSCHLVGWWRAIQLGRSMYLYEDQMILIKYIQHSAEANQWFPSRLIVLVVIIMSQFKSLVWLLITYYFPHNNNWTIFQIIIIEYISWALWSLFFQDQSDYWCQYPDLSLGEDKGGPSSSQRIQLPHFLSGKLQQ